MTHSPNLALRGELIRAQLALCFPDGLLEGFASLVEANHRRCGLGSVPNLIATQLSDVPMPQYAHDLVAATRNAIWMRRVCWILILAIAGLSWFVSKWFLVGLVVLLPYERICASLQHNGFVVLATVLLCLEVLVNDFAGWGSAYPECRSVAVDVLKADPERPRTVWLDFYLPRRQNMAAADLRKFRASERRGGESLISPIALIANQ